MKLFVEKVNDRKYLRKKRYLNAPRRVFSTVIKIRTFKVLTQYLKGSHETVLAFEGFTFAFY